MIGGTNNASEEINARRLSGTENQGGLRRQRYDTGGRRQEDESRAQLHEQTYRPREQHEGRRPDEPVQTAGAVGDRSFGGRSMTDEGKAAVVISLWTIAFNAGILLAASMSKSIGFMLAISATLILITFFRADARIEAERRRRKKYQEDIERRIEEVLSNGSDIHSDR